MIADQSALQQIGFTLTQVNPIDIFGFLELQNINVWIPIEAKNEVGYQVYQPNFFSGVYNDNNSTACGEYLVDKAGYVLSRSNGSLTPINLQPNGFKVTLVNSSALCSETFTGQKFLWDNSSIMQKLLKNRRSLADSANITLARCFRKEGKNAFVFVNDQNQIKQLKFEGIEYLRPDKLFGWMCRDGYIDPRKGGWNFKKRREHNNRWTGPIINFKDILH